MDIPRIVVAATQSGSGKTTIVTGLLAALRSRGLKVQSYKIGPDYIDPGYHELASGCPGYNIDTWLVPAARLQAMFGHTAEKADLAVIEGVMGLYDGGRGGVSSTAEIAKLLDAPVLLVIDAKAMGASAAAIALGFREYDRDVKLAGVILNRLGSDTHGQMIAAALAELDIPLLGALRRDDGLKMPQRHLGLLPVTENEEKTVVSKIEEAVSSQIDVAGIIDIADTAAAWPSRTMDRSAKKDLVKNRPEVRIAVAKDEAFSFYYPDSLAVLQSFGAAIVPFSPLHDRKLPDADGVILGGGFPEMFASQLYGNEEMRSSIKQAASAGMPIYAECGGFMYLMQGLIDFAGKPYPMAGVLPGRVQMNKKLQMVGYVTARMERDTILGAAGTELHGHEFHFSAEQGETVGYPRAYTFTRLRNGAVYEAGYAKDNILGSYLHIHFAGCPSAADHFVGCCRAYRLGGA
jgi:cobyrinic acid a,c-diamide synthase